MKNKKEILEYIIKNDRCKYNCYKCSYKLKHPYGCDQKSVYEDIELYKKLELITK